MRAVLIYAQRRRFRRCVARCGCRDPREHRRGFVL